MKNLFNKQQLMFNLGETEVCYETVLEAERRHAIGVDLFPLNDYDYILISSSGGKDSMTMLFWLLEQGVDKRKIELWHQCVDGNFQDRVEFFDWPVTESYLHAVSEHFDIPIYFQWRSEGIYGELLRTNSLTNDVCYTDNGKIYKLKTKNGKLSTRRKWPAQSANLSTRWCSAYVKIDVFRRVLNNHPKYKGTPDEPKKILVLTGERREESLARSKYMETEIHACNSRSRITHAFRPVIDFSEEKIWHYYEKYRFLPHPAYLLGWNRTSCFSCIFQTNDLFAMMREIAPERFNQLVQMEKELDHTIDSNRVPLEVRAKLGSIDRLPKDARLSKWVNVALSRSFNKEDLIMDKWELPTGAFKGGGLGGSY